MRNALFELYFLGIVINHPLYIAFIGWPNKKTGEGRIWDKLLNLWYVFRHNSLFFFAFFETILEESLYHQAC